MILWLLLAILTLCQADPAWAQRTWPNDSAGRPAPPCVTFDPSTNTTSFCPSGAQPGGALSATQETTGYGKQWYTSAQTFPTGTSHRPGVVFLSDNVVIGVRQQTGSTTNLEVWQSVDAGKSFTRSFVPTGLADGNRTTGLAADPTSPSVLLLTRANNGGAGGQPLVANNPYVSWVTSTGTVVGTATHSPKMNNATAIVAQGVTICRGVVTGTPSLTLTCSTPPGPPTAFVEGAGVFAFTGTANTWIAIDGASPARLYQSVDDGVSWSLITTLTVGGAGVGRSVSCLTGSSGPICLAIAGSNIHRSTNGGTTWALQYTHPNVFPKAFVDHGSNIVSVVGDYFASGTAPSAAVCPFECSTATLAPNSWARSADGGVTWLPILAPWLQAAGATTDAIMSAISRAGSSIVMPGSGVNTDCTNGLGGTPRCYAFSPTTALGFVKVATQSGATGIRTDASGAMVVTGGGIAGTPTAGVLTIQGITGGTGVPISGATFTAPFHVTPIQTSQLSNQTTTGAAATAVAHTISGIANRRGILYKLHAQCSAGAATLTIQDTGGPVSLWVLAGNIVPAAPAYLEITWPGPGLSASLNNGVTVTAGSCGAGNTTTLNTQMDRVGP